MHGTAQAQQPPVRRAPPRPDSTKVIRPVVDTLKKRADSLKTARDTTKTPGDTLRAGADTLKQKGDTLGQKGDTLRQQGDTLRQLPDSLRARRDSLRADSLRIDSLERENLAILAAQIRRGDTIKVPTPAAEMPVLTDLDGGYRWGREELAASGALTLGDLLDGIPGFTVFRAGWIGSPQVGAMMGDLQRVRLFYDGIELDALDPRNGGLPDLSFVQLWPLEEVRIERGASEIRVHLRTWRVRSTTPGTRVDIGTGDLETNGYRGYFGRRWRNGTALQVGASQFATRDNRGAGDADGLSLFGRVGWARGRFSADASFLRSSRDRTEQRRDSTEGDNIPAFDGHQTEAYARVAYRDTTRGAWAQLTAASLAHVQNNLAYTDTIKIPFRRLPSQLTPSRTQLIAAAGWERGPLAVSATARMRRIDSLNYLTPSARLAFETSRVALAGFAEQQEERKLRRVEVSGRLLPLSWFGVSGAVSRYSPTEVGLFPTTLAYRGEVGVRISRAWLSGGIMSRDTAFLAAPMIFDTTFAAGAAGAATGTFVSLRGKIWKDVGFDVTALKWDSAGAYRPQYQTRTQLYLNTGWLSRFPSGNFNVLASVTHEYRTQAYFLRGDGQLESSQYRTINAQLEIRLLQATLSYQFRNLLNEQYQQVPGFFMNRPVQYYGVRWYFFN